MIDDRDGLTPVRLSTAEAGDVAPLPTDGGGINIIEVTDVDDEPAGLLIEWKSENDSCWMWAEVGSYGDLID
ncbi:hypothetical protein [Halomonas sp.]|uniref:hypothetical protein n=1 Tax=Halomonas sp. TaxID=1486246 RepID=UPI003566F16A